MKAMLAAAVLLCGATVRRVRGEIHLGSGLGRIGMVDVRHGSLRGRRLASRCSVWVGAERTHSGFIFVEAAVGLRRNLGHLFRRNSLRSF